MYQQEGISVGTEIYVGVSLCHYTSYSMSETDMHFGFNKLHTQAHANIHRAILSSNEYTVLAKLSVLQVV